MAFPTTAIPVGHFQGLGNLSGNEADSLRNLLNRVRESLDFGGFQVDPDNPDRFSTVNEAYAVGVLELAAGEPISIEVAPGKVHVLTEGVLSVLGTHPLFISANPSALVGDWSGNDADEGTQITGDITLAVADAVANRLPFGLRGVHLRGDIAANSNWQVTMVDGTVRGKLTRTHGTNGVELMMVNVRNFNDPFQVIDVDKPASPGDGAIVVHDCVFYGGFPTGPLTFWDIKGSIVNIHNTQIWVFMLLGGNTLTLFDLNSDADNQLYLQDVSVFGEASAVDTLQLVGNGGSSMVQLDNILIAPNQTDDLIVDVGGPIGDLKGYGLTIRSRVAPINPVVGTEWKDLELNDKFIWDGTYWGANGVYRKDILVDIGSAALNHDVGFDLPAAGAVISSSFKLLKALTGASGAIQAGLGTGSAGDPDKYAETASLAIDQKDQNLHATWNDGGGDDLQITAETAPATAGGTIAGSGDEDARVTVYFMLPKTLP